MRKSFVVCLLLAACQPLYGNKPAEMKDPERRRPKPGEVAAAPEIPWDETCDSKFFEKPSTAKPRRTVVQEHVTAANQALAASDADDVSGKQKSSLVITAIDEYKQALVEDPYDVEATYGLAVAYATVYKKKCALDLINRLVALRAHPSYEADAKRLLAAAYSESAFTPFKSSLP
jgi:hypothetical protein